MKHRHELDSRIIFFFFVGCSLESATAVLCSSDNSQLYSILGQARRFVHVQINDTGYIIGQTRPGAVCNDRAIYRGVAVFLA